MKMTHQVNGSAIVIDGLGQPDIQTAKADAIAKPYSPTQDCTFYLLVEFSRSDKMAECLFS